MDLVLLWLLILKPKYTRKKKNNHMRRMSKRVCFCSFSWTLSVWNHKAVGGRGWWQREALLVPRRPQQVKLGEAIWCFFCLVFWGSTSLRQEPYRLIEILCGSERSLLWRPAPARTKIGMRRRSFQLSREDCSSEEAQLFTDSLFDPTPPVLLLSCFVHRHLRGLGFGWSWAWEQTRG